MEHPMRTVRLLRVPYNGEPKRSVLLMSDDLGVVAVMSITAAFHVDLDPRNVADEVTRCLPDTMRLDFDAGPEHTQEELDKGTDLRPQLPANKRPPPLDRFITLNPGIFTGEFLAAFVVLGSLAAACIGWWFGK